jgi:integrase
VKEKLTERLLDGLPQAATKAGKTVYYYDTVQPRFGAACTKNGAVSFFVQYRMGGRGTPSKRLVLGKRGEITLDAARKMAEQKRGEVRRGIDIVQAKKDAREKHTGLTFKDAAERYLALHEKQTRYWKEKRARLVSDDVKAIADVSMATIERARIAKAIADVQKRSNAAARLLFADIRPIFTWALDQGIIESNPMQGMRGPAISEARDRVLTDDEVKALWQVLSEEGWPFENVFKLLLLTGQRREGVAGMRWREIDLDATTWTIAKERAKNGKAHLVDLSAEAVRLLDPIGDAAAPRLAKSTDDLVFSTTGTTSVSGFSKAKARIDARMKALLGDKFQPWRTHDLRRTAASGMAALGFQPHVIERVLNHVSGAQGGLVGVYQRHEYREERKRALAAWGERVAQIVSAGETTPQNIVSFPSCSKSGLKENSLANEVR